MLDKFRFLPYPVVGRFLAGTGWLLVTGALGLMVDMTPDLDHLSALLQVDILLHWLRGLLFAVILMGALSRLDHFLILPGLIVGAIVVFYGVAWLTGTSAHQLGTGGWLVDPFPSQALWQPLFLSDLGMVNWAGIGRQLPNVGAIVFLSTVALLLNVTGLETVLQRDIGLGRELRASGLGNLLAGIAGGLVGYQQLSVSVLNQKAGQGSRLAGVWAAILCGLAVWVGAGRAGLTSQIELSAPPVRCPG